MAEEIKKVKAPVEKEVKIEEPKKEKSKEVEIPKNLEKIVKDIEEMKVVDLAKLVSVLEDKFGVSAAPMAVAAAPVSAGPVEEGGGKATVNLVLVGFGDKKVAVIKAIKAITQKGLKDCKDIEDATANEPQVVKEEVKREEAEEMKKKIETAGGVALLK